MRQTLSATAEPAVRRRGRRPISRPRSRCSETPSGRMSTSSSTRLASIPTRSGSRPTSLPGRSSRSLNADRRRREILRTCESAYTLRCLSSTCIPSGRSTTYQFDPGRVSFARVTRTAPDEDSVRVPWPSFRVFSRVRCRGPSEQPALVSTLAGGPRLTSRRVVPARAWTPRRRPSRRRSGAGRRRTRARGRGVASA